MRGRPMHPTSPLRAEPATLPTEVGRRHATKPGARTADRRREDEEGRLRPVARRQEEFQPPPIDREITIAEGTTISVTFAPRARIRVNASWPGVSMNTMFLPFFST